MGFLEKLFSPEEDYQISTTSRSNDNREIKGMRTGHMKFTSAEECQKLSSGLRWKLHTQKKDIEFIRKHLPMEGNDLANQAEAMEALIIATNNDQDEDVQRAFATFQNLFKEDLAKAKGKAAVEKLESINEKLKKWFHSLSSINMIDIKEFEAVIAEVEAIDKNVEESETAIDFDGGDMEARPILTRVDRDSYNILTLETEYRLKMMELLYLMSKDEWGLLNRKDYENPFDELSEEQQIEFARLLDSDMSTMADDYERLSANEDIINKYGCYGKFSQIDNYADNVNFVLDKQMVRDYSLEKMFGGEISKGELFDFIAKTVFIRLKLNNMQKELPEVKEKAETAKKTEAEQARKKAEEEAEQARKAIEDEQKRKEEEEKNGNIFTKNPQDKETLEKLRNATDEEIQAEIDRLNHDVRNEGSRYVNIYDFQRRMAIIKGLLPEDDIVESNNVCTLSYTGSEIISFIKEANASGFNYSVFPNSNEAGEGKFSVLISNKNKGDFKLPGHKFRFDGPDRYRTTTDDRIEKGKRLGTVPGYFLDEVYRLYEESSDEHKDSNKQFFYIIKESGKTDTYEIGYMDNSYISDYDLASRGQTFMLRLIKKAYLNLQEQWRDTGEDRDVLCYLSVPATRNVLPVLQAFKDKGITPFFERTADSEKRNTKNRDNIHIYFRREDIDRFTKDVVPVLEMASGVQKVPYELHYGKNYNFIEENSNDLHVEALRGVTPEY